MRVFVQIERQPGGYWLVMSSLVLFQRLLYMIRCTVAAAILSHYRGRLSATGSHDVMCQSSSGSVIALTSGESYELSGEVQKESSETYNVAFDNSSDEIDMTSQTTRTDVSMMRTGCHDNDVTSYSVLSASDVSQLLPVSSTDDDQEEECRMSDELREISRDLADIRACAQLVSARCHDDKWRRGDALTLGVTEAVTPRTSQTTHIVSRHWANMSTIVDWRLDESASEYESRDSCREVMTSGYTDDRLSLTRVTAELMTSSPADDSVADIYFDDEMDDVFA